MEANAPNRCQRVIVGGQCTNEALPGVRYCERHTGSQGNEMKHYLITGKLLGDSARRHAGVNEIKSLRDEIALTRATVEILVNSIETQAELTAAMPRIHAGVLAIEKLVNTCHQMEVKLGVLLDKAALLTLAQSIINIISEAVKDLPNRDAIVERVAADIIEAIAKQENKNG